MHGNVGAGRVSARFILAVARFVSSSPSPATLSS